MSGWPAIHAMAEEPGASAETDSGETQSMQELLKSMHCMQKQMGVLMQKVTDIEHKYEEDKTSSSSEFNAVSDSKNDDEETDTENGDVLCSQASPADGVGVSKKGDCSSAGGESSGVQKHGVSVSKKGDGSSAGGESSGVQVFDTASDAGFCVEQDEESDVFSLLEAELEVGEKLGKPVTEKLANITNSRFTTKMPFSKLEEKMTLHQIPENSTTIRPPVLNDEVIEKGNLNKFVRRNDTRLENVQKLLSGAAAALVNASHKLHTRIGTASAEVSRREFAAAANEILTASGDVIALLGTAQQELSYRRRFQLQSALPRDMASICINDSIPVTDKLFGGDIDKAIRTARETFRLKNTQAGFNNRFHPYKRSQ